MLRKVEGVTACLWSAIVHFTLPLNGSEGPKVTTCARDQVIIKDGIELTYLPPGRVAPRRNPKNVPIIIANPFRQFGGQPAKDRMCCSVLVRGPRATRLVLSVADHLLISRGVVSSQLSPVSCGFKKMNVQALFAIVVMAQLTAFATRLGLGTVRLLQREISFDDICYLLYDITMISYLYICNIIV